MNLNPYWIFVMFVLGYGASSYVSYKYNSFKTANEELSKLVNKWLYLLDWNNAIAEKYDDMNEWNEVSRKIVK